MPNTLEAPKTIIKINKNGALRINPSGVSLERDKDGRYGFLLPLRAEGAGGKIISELTGFSVPAEGLIERNEQYPLFDLDLNKVVGRIRFVGAKRLKDERDMKRIPLSVSNGHEIDNSYLHLVLDRYPETANVAVFFSGRLMVVYNVVPELVDISQIASRRVASKLRSQIAQIINTNNF